jgi:hypothetical protein
MTLVLTILAVIGAPLLGLWLWIWLARSEQGERYIKQRMQGPFVPLDERDSPPDR